MPGGAFFCLSAGHWRITAGWQRGNKYCSRVFGENIIRTAYILLCTVQTINRKSQTSFFSLSIICMGIPFLSVEANRLRFPVRSHIYLNVTGSAVYRYGNRVTFTVIPYLLPFGIIKCNGCIQELVLRVNIFKPVRSVIVSNRINTGPGLQLHYVSIGIVRIYLMRLPV